MRLNLPIVGPEDCESADLDSWFEARGTQEAGALLRARGALLLRGFSDPGLAGIEVAATRLTGSAMAYSDRVTKRTPVAGNVLTATDTPASQTINMHCENTFAARWPRNLLLACVTPPKSGGRTPLADVTGVYRRLRPETRARFETLGVRYVRNFGHRLGMSWQETFQVEDRATLERQAEPMGLELTWINEDRLRATQTQPAVLNHPTTGESCWFNHAMTLNIRFMAPELRDMLVRQLKPEDLPHNSYYGDGSVIEDDVLDEIWAAYEAESIWFDWQAGDVLVLDNLRVAHGREPYEGQRSIVARLADACSWKDVEHSGQFKNSKPNVSTDSSSAADAGGATHRALVEAALLRAVQEVLTLGTVRLQDDFLDIGGDSVSATRIVARVRAEAGHEFSLWDFLEATSLEDLLRGLEGPTT